MNKRNLVHTNLRLNLDKPDDRQAWTYLQQTDKSQPGYASYSKIVVTAINDHFSRQDQNDHDTILLQKIEKVIDRTLARYMKDIRITESNIPSYASDSKQQKETSEETIADIEAFLDSF